MRGKSSIYVYIKNGLPMRFLPPLPPSNPPQINEPKIRIFGICKHPNFVVYCDCRLGKAQSDKNKKYLAPRVKGRKIKL